jgi:hypothetical protein
VELPGGAQRLNPAQQEVLALLRLPVEERIEVDAALRHELRYELESGLAPLVGQLPADDTLWLGKHDLSSVHGCEASYLAEADLPFEWSVALARGAVVHKAVELSVHLPGQPSPLALVDEALARLEHADKPVTDFIQRCTESERAELRASANDSVAKFVESFPPLERGWKPVTESRTRIELCEGRIILQGRVDLTLGSADGLRSGKVIVDLKTGSFSPDHTPDLRFYALLETLRVGTPPCLLASYYLDSGRPQHERVTEGVLEAAVVRTVAAAERLVELRHGGASPTKRTGARCRWCAIAAGCREGQAFLNGTDDPERDLDLDELDLDELGAS